MGSETRNYYLFQAVNMLPQFLVPVLAIFFEASVINKFALELVLVNVFAAVLDWGASTIGSKRLRDIGEIDIKEKVIAINAIEKVRLLVFCILIAVLIVFTSMGVLGLGHDLFSLGLLIGVCAAYFYPSWVVLGSIVKVSIVRVVLIYRVLSIGIVFLLLQCEVNINLCGFLYFGSALIGALFVRRNFLPEDVTFYSVLSSKGINSCLVSGLAVTFGAVLSYFITGSGSALIINRLSSESVVDFLVAACFLSAARFVVGIVSSRMFINSYRFNLEEKIYLTLVKYSSFLLAILVCSLLLMWLIYNNTRILTIYVILYLGFALIGPSHLFVTMGALARGMYFKWLSILTVGFIIYLIVIGFGVFYLNVNMSYIAASATFCAEFIIFFIGYLYWRKNGSI